MKLKNSTLVRFIDNLQQNIYFKHFQNLTTPNTNYVVGDSNLNLPDHRINAKVKFYPNLSFKNFFISAIKKPNMTKSFLCNKY